MKHTQLASALLVLSLGSLVHSTAVAAEAFYPKGTKGTLTIDYLYEADGKWDAPSRGNKFSYKYKHTGNFVYVLEASEPSPISALLPLTAAQKAEQDRKTKKAQALANEAIPKVDTKAMQDMAGSMEEILDKCGDDDACAEREAMRYMTDKKNAKQMNDVARGTEAAQKYQAGITALVDQGPPRYQLWGGGMKKGSYTVDETSHFLNGDPICMGLGYKNDKCTRDESRKGSGSLPSGKPDDVVDKLNQGGVVIEYDSKEGKVITRLPTSYTMWATEVIITDEPDGTYSTPTPVGPHKIMISRPENEAAHSRDAAPLSIPLKGSWKNQSGEQVIKTKGPEDEDGTVTVRWRFTVG